MKILEESKKLPPNISYHQYSGAYVAHIRIRGKRYSKQSKDLPLLKLWLKKMREEKENG